MPIIYLNQELKVMKVKVQIYPDSGLSTSDAKELLKTWNRRLLFCFFSEGEPEGEMLRLARNWKPYWSQAIFERGVELGNITAL